MISILVVDDSAFMRKWMSDAINQQEDLQVVAIAKNGKQAIELITKGTISVDVITMDVEMPVIDGLEAVEVIMKQNPTPIIMVSTLTRQGATETIRALTLGAFDFVQKPSGAISLNMELVEEELFTKIRLAKQANVQSTDSERVRPNASVSDEINRSATKKVIAIGASTGGPRVLQHVLERLPPLDVPIFIVQHMPKTFTETFAQRLDRICKMPVKEATDGERVKNGVVYVAPGDRHMLIKELKSGTKTIELRVDSPFGRDIHQPSVNSLFYSLATIEKTNVLAVVLTGMGNDGMNGLTLLKKEQEVMVIAESKQSAVVYGMPKAVIDTGLADYVVPAKQMATEMLKALRIL
ncbi:chemotaxis response regulator protein-glutamate methylesterase [Geomicrobium sp. JCM 19038]|uniref:protein-glutamate methylesterase/protein-glutamine glutaminase n=1 Tax=Geomicrobium sp. JCM 19038 TaxID=1460635 RepID=UPI00045F3AF8|nr:chemotaxis response regulator protein-glutamate methylesterase [Geomicrobium sp. JCM 19038]GAK07546.1 chemotaxis response regulator protein-glutamate methylesterase CheB [Geomicrobium sp. JCM 19038]